MTRPMARPSLRPWFTGYRCVVCTAVPWAVRMAVLVAVSQACAWPLATWASDMLSLWPGGLGGGLGGRSEPRVPDAGHECVCPDIEDGCSTFTGQPLACHELRRAREFNSKVMPSMLLASYREIRRAMTAYGLYGSGWHVGHACPDPHKGNTTDREDEGWNLFAQHATDNVKLGHCLVSCAETEFMAAFHVQCTRSSACVASCPTAAI